MRAAQLRIEKLHCIGVGSLDFQPHRIEPIDEVPEIALANGAVCLIALEHTESDVDVVDTDFLQESQVVAIIVNDYQCWYADE